MIVVDSAFQISYPRAIQRIGKERNCSKTEYVSISFAAELKFVSQSVSCIAWLELIIRTKINQLSVIII